MPVQVNVLATMLFILTVAAMAVTIIQQRRAESLAATRPDDVQPPPVAA